MILKEISIENYRNLKNFKIESNSTTKYIFGNNGVGKSNLLELLNILFNKNSFSELDFNDLDSKIKVELKINLSNLEMGYFDDLFELENINDIVIVASQDTPNSRIEFWHKESESPIPYSKIKNIPLVYYNSVGAPEELTFNKSKTTGKFLNSIIKKYIESENLNPEDFIVAKKMDDILANINNYLSKIELINKNGVSAKIENNAIDLIPKLVGLANEENISVNKMGAGIRYLSYIFFEILNTIFTSVEGDNNIKFTNIEGKTYLPIIVVLDEPEIHLHPFMQRKLIKHVNSILANEDKEFSNLLKEYFKIDGLIGQLIISTHSPYILSNNYKNYIRIYNDANGVNSVSGDSFDLGEDEKLLLQNIQDIKESFFSQCTLIFEGISEAGTIPSFANKLGFDLDDYDISVISADGEGGVEKLKILLEKFNIKVLAAKDKDVNNPENIVDGVFYTADNDFECDIYNKLVENDCLEELYKVIEEYEKKNVNNIIIQKGKLEKTVKSLKISYTIDSSVKLGDVILGSDKILLKISCLAWLYTYKNMIRGRILGEKISAINIPIVYSDIILKAKEYSCNV